MSTTVLLADDHKMVRDGLRALLTAEPGVQIIAEADNGRTAVRLAAELRPDVVVMDINMPLLNGIEATRQIASQDTGIKVVVLSGHNDQRFVSETLRAGASGYVLKESAFDDLTLGIRAAASGKTYVSPGAAGCLIDNFMNGRGTSVAPANPLTPREREVLQLLAEGKATKEAAMLLHISVKTAETHRRNIMEKLDIDSVAELTKYAIRAGITSVLP